MTGRLWDIARRNRGRGTRMFRQSGQLLAMLFVGLQIERPMLLETFQTAILGLAAREEYRW